MEITMQGISKAFGSNEVLRGVDFTLHSGEIHALMGENGAGKSTLMNILTGIHKADAGKIFVDGQEVHFKNARDAENHGIAFIHQELNIWPNLSILENLFLMKQITNSFGILDTKKMRKLAEEKCAQIGIELPLDAEAGECSVGQQQMTEIIRNLMLDAKVVIMDEPTAALTKRESEELYEYTEKLREGGASIIFISHRFEDMYRLADRVTVLRDAQYIGTWDVDAISNEDMIIAMVGREIKQLFPKRKIEIGEEILRVEKLGRTGYFKDISFDVKKGEIVALTGLVGAGRSEVAETVFGIAQPSEGTVYVDGKEVKIKSPTDATCAGLGLLPEDRQKTGVDTRLGNF